VLKEIAVQRRPRVTAVLTAACLALIAPGLGSTSASADHTDPGGPLSPVLPQPAAGALTAGEGEWEHLANLGPMMGSDLEFFTKAGVTFVAGGTLGQGPTPGFVGQRVVQLTDGSGAVIEPEIVADHGSALCDVNTAVTGLQHDVQAVPTIETELLIDTTDAVGRCHDTPGGGIEILDVTGLGEDGFEVREIALMRFNGTTHTVTADVDIPGILYNNGSEFGPAGSNGPALAWTDVIDIRSCLGLAGQTLEQKRAACQPVTYRFPYQPEWSSKKLADGTLVEPANCHDTTARPGRLYCAALNATMIFDTTGLLDGSGKVRGTPLPCTVVDGTETGAKVTDCITRPEGSTGNPSVADAVKAYEDLGRPRATGLRFLGSVNHPGRNCSPLPPTTLTCNTNTVVRSDEGVAVAHEADPTPDGDFMFVTDERGGGVVPPGATCSPGLDNPVGNGGMHVFDIRDPARIVQAESVDGGPAVYIGTSPTPSPTFCTIHVIEQVPGEARIMAAYYDGGTKIVDYSVDADGKWAFEEVAAYRLPGANTWASEVFKTTDNEDGTRTYFIASNSFALGEGTARGLDVFTWTGAPNPLVASGGTAPAPVDAPPAQAPPVAAPAAGSLPATGADVALATLALVLLPMAYGVRRLRGRRESGA
jgi:hypothetical protein